MAHRPRRTRIYGANYDIGESYYKQQLDNLDRKNGYSRFSSEPFQVERELNTPLRSMPKVSFSNENDDFFKPQERPAFNMKKFMEDDDLDTVYKPMSIHNPKSRINNINADWDYEGSHDVPKRSHHFSTDGCSQLLSEVENEGIDKLISTRSKLKSSSYVSENGSKEEHAASMRMKATKARLADLETEMLNISERSNEREKRNSRLKKLVGEIDSDFTA